ncbi:hypothetical protein N9801_00935 [Yoonia sp.]|nr:hypothetical protein [Yoonia sp.]
MVYLSKAAKWSKNQDQLLGTLVDATKDQLQDKVRKIHRDFQAVATITCERLNHGS